MTPKAGKSPAGNGANSAGALLDELERLPSSRRREWILSSAPYLTDEFFVHIKERVNQLLATDTHRALELAESALNAAALTGKPLHKTLALISKANVYGFGLGRYAEAQEIFEEAVRLGQTCGADTLVRRVRMAQVYVLGLLGRFDEAFALGEKVRQECLEAEDWLTYVAATNNMAIAARRRGDLNRALALQNEHKSILNTHLVGTPVYYERLFRLELSRSVIFVHMNAFQSAIEAAEEARRVADEVLCRPAQIARARNVLGLIHFYLGRYNDALAYFQEARRIFLQAHLERDAVVAQLFETQCLLALNDLEAVETAASRIIEYSLAAGMDHEAAMALVYRTQARRRLGRLLAAAKDLEQAGLIFKQHNNDVWLGQVYLELAYVLLATESPFEADLAAEAAQLYFARLNLPLNRAQALLAQGLAAERLDMSDVARRLYREVLTIGQRERLATLVYPACYGLARLEKQAGRMGAARARLLQAIQAVEELRGEVAVELRVPFLADKLEIYNEMVALELEAGNTEAAFRFVQRARARALLDLLGDEHSARLHVRTPEEQILVDEINQLRERWRWLQRRALHIPPRATSGWKTSDWELVMVSEEEREALLAEARHCEAQIRALFRELQVRQRSQRDEAGLTSVPDGEVCPHVSPETLLVEYFSLGDMLWAFVINADQVVASPLCPVVEVRHLMARWRLLLANATSLGPNMGRRLPAIRRVLGTLYEKLFAPLARHADGCTRLYVVPHGVLHYLPFAALYDASTGTYVVEQFAVARLPSGSLLPLLKARRRKEKRQGKAPLVLGFSHHNLLPVAIEEAQHIADLTGAECYLEEEATSSRLSNVQAWRPFVHIAAHGTFRPDEPLFSAVYLADGPLTTLDLFGLSLPTALLVLSACETGLGVVHPGDEIVGLSRACLHAGAQALLLSLWRVEDAHTRDFMVEFYTSLVAGLPPAKALAHVQRQWLREEATAHPFYWAAFSITGDAFVPLFIPSAQHRADHSPPADMV